MTRYTPPRRDSQVITRALWVDWRSWHGQKGNPAEKRN